MPEITDALTNWSAQLAAWAIPDEILAGAEDSPWVLSTAVFSRRADARLVDPASPSFDRAREALPAGGSLLDVGAGAGAAGLPLARAAGASLLALDQKAEMLEAVEVRSAAAGVPCRLVEGRWPDVAPTVPATDVVVCHHVLYNVPDLALFAAALTAHARRRVVVELTERHPLTALAPLWLRFHGLERPTGPTADDAVAALRSMGIAISQERWQTPRGRDYGSFDELVDVTRRQLCLPRARSPEVATALLDLGADPQRPTQLGPRERELATLWWDGAAPSG